MSEINCTACEHARKEYGRNCTAHMGRGKPAQPAPEKWPDMLPWSCPRCSNNPCRCEPAPDPTQGVNARYPADGVMPAAQASTQRPCERCGDLFYHPKTIIADLKQHAAEWEELAKEMREQRDGIARDLERASAERDRLAAENVRYYNALQSITEDGHLDCRWCNHNEAIASEALKETK